jgi:hypothetical protein
MNDDDQATSSVAEYVAAAHARFAAALVPLQERHDAMVTVYNEELARADREVEELQAVAAEAVTAFALYPVPENDRLVHAMHALDCVLRGEPPPPKWLAESCIEADP